MPADTLSIVIPTFQRTDLLRNCLRSVVRHAPAGTEIIVVADGSTGTDVSDFPGVQLVRLSRRSGFCAAANAGIAAAIGEIVELLNDDTEVTAGWAETALGCFGDPRVAAVAPLVLMSEAKGASGGRQPPGFIPRNNQGADAPRSPDIAIIDSAGDDYDLGGFARKRGHGEPLSPRYLHRQEVFGASGSSAFYRRDLLLRVGGFPREFGAYFEDVDLAFRLRRTGGEIIYEPASVVLHRGGSSYGRTNRRLLEQQSCNEERVWWRNLSPRDVIRSLPRHVAVLAGKAVRRLGEGTFLSWIFGRMRAWSEIGVCRQHHRQMFSRDVESAEGSAMTSSHSPPPTPRRG